ncbi:MAG: N-acetylmuramoyl-L-alanine amidase [Candidatus Omnitrophota bacterium]
MRRFLAISIAFLILGTVSTAYAQSFWIKGYKYYPLYKICQEKDIGYAWDAAGRVATLEKGGVVAKIRIGSDKALVDDKELIDIGPPVYFHEETVVIPSTFANKGIFDIFRRSKKKSSSAKKSKGSSHRIKTVVLDPGHGGKDPGAISRYYNLKEKEINLDIAKRLKNILKASGIDVYLTRSTDVFVPLPDRAEFAGSKEADLFISVHSNSSRSGWTRGLEIYYLSERKGNDSDRALQAANEGSSGHSTTAEAIEYDLRFTENMIVSQELAESVIKSIKKSGIYAGRKSIRDAAFHVLKNFRTVMPAILVETGYISNKKEAGLLRTSSYRQKVAQSIANGVLTYSKEYARENGFSR